MTRWRSVSQRKVLLSAGGVIVVVILAAVLFPAFPTSHVLAPIPFDPALNLSVTVEGEFHGYGAGQAHLKLTPTVTAYAPDEPFQELEAELSPDEWVEGVIQSFDPAQLPQGWTFFAPFSDLTLHLTVEDQKARLVKVVVKDWEGQILGEVLASPDGKRVSGSLNYDLAIEAVVIEIWGKGSSSQLLARGVSTTPRGDDGFWFETRLGFHPHPENPRRTDGVLAEAKFLLHSRCIHQAIYPDNDSPDAKPERPTGDFATLKTKEIVKDTTDLRKAPPKIVGELNKRISELAAQMKTADVALSHAIIPPFSREIEAIWNIVTMGEGHAWIAVPYYEKEIRRIKVEAELAWRISEKTPPPPKAPEVSREWAGGIKLTLEEKRKWKVGDPIAIGDLWGIAVGSPPVHPRVSAKSILQEVTVRIDRDIVCGPIASGSVTIEKKEVLPHVGWYKDPKTGEKKQEHPPYNPPAPNSVSLDQNGVGKVQVPKGFRYIFKNPGLKSFPSIYEINPTEQTIDVPPDSTVTFNAKLTNLVVLKVYVYTNPLSPAAQMTANVWLYKRRPDGSFPESPTRVAGVSEVEQGGTKYWVATFQNISLDKQPDSTYQAIYKVKVFLAKDIPHTPYENIWEFSPSCEDVRSATVQLKIGQGPGGE